MLRTIILLYLTALICACTGPRVSYHPIVPGKAALPAGTQVDLYLPGSVVGRDYSVIGLLSIGDTGLSINCDWNDVIVIAKQKAQEAGAQGVLLTEIREPDFFGSTCYRIKAELIAYDTAISHPFTVEPRPEISLVAEPLQMFGNTERWAVIVGISTYADSALPALPFADDDASMLSRWLIDADWSPSHIRTLLNAEATERNIRIALESWLTKSRPNDILLVFWSGHGFPDPEDPEKVYFACYDTDSSIPATGFRMDRVVQILEERNARNVIILADTCHAGKLVTRGDRGLSVIPKVRRMQEDDTIPKGWVFMVSADTDRRAVEHSSWRNGAFTYCILQGLRGRADGFQSAGRKDGTVTLGELRAYLSTAMPHETQKVLGVAKHPLITTSTGNPDIWNLTLQAK